MAKKAPFDDTERGWGLARLFAEFCGDVGKHPSLKKAIILRTWNADKYTAWVTKLRLEGYNVDWD